MPQKISNRTYIIGARSSYIVLPSRTAAIINQSLVLRCGVWVGGGWWVVVQIAFPGLSLQRLEAPVSYPTCPCSVCKTHRRYATYTCLHTRAYMFLSMLPYDSIVSATYRHSAAAAAVAHVAHAIRYHCANQRIGVVCVYFFRSSCIDIFLEIGYFVILCLGETCVLVVKGGILREDREIYGQTVLRHVCLIVIYGFFLKGLRNVRRFFFQLHYQQIALDNTCFSRQHTGKYLWHRIIRVGHSSLYKKCHTLTLYRLNDYPIQKHTITITLINMYINIYKHVY